MLAARKMLTDFVNKGSRHTQVSHYGILFPAICIFLHLIFMSPLFPLKDLGPHCSWGKSWSWMSLHLPEGDLAPSFIGATSWKHVRWWSVEYAKFYLCAISSENRYRITNLSFNWPWDDKGVGRGRGKGLNFMIRETFMLTNLMISFCNAF